MDPYRPCAFVGTIKELRHELQYGELLPTCMLNRATIEGEGYLFRELATQPPAVHEFKDNE